MLKNGVNNSKKKEVNLKEVSYRANNILKKRWSKMEFARRSKCVGLHSNKFLLNLTKNVRDFVRLRFFIFKLKFFGKMRLKVLYKKRFYRLLRIKFSFVKKVIKYWRKIIGYNIEKFFNFFLKPSVGLANNYKNLYLNEFGYLINKNVIKKTKLFKNLYNLKQLKHSFGKRIYVYYKIKKILLKFVGWLCKQYKFNKFYWHKFFLRKSLKVNNVKYNKIYNKFFKLFILKQIKEKLNYNLRKNKYWFYNLSLKKNKNFLNSNNKSIYYLISINNNNKNSIVNKKKSRMFYKMRNKRISNFINFLYYSCRFAGGQIIKFKNVNTHIVRAYNNIFVTAAWKANKVAFVLSAGKVTKGKKKKTYEGAKWLGVKASKYAIKRRFTFGCLHIRSPKRGLLRSVVYNFARGCWFEKSLVHFILPHNGVKLKKRRRV